MLKGEAVVINAFFTTCSSVCPPMSRNLEKVQEALGDRLGKDVFIASISVDPTTDTDASEGVRVDFPAVRGVQRDLKDGLTPIAISLIFYLSPQPPPSTDRQAAEYKFAPFHLNGDGPRRTVCG
jgi:hypothetical protein